jgi:hypothetical protein
MRKLGYYFPDSLRSTVFKKGLIVMKLSLLLILVSSLNLLAAGTPTGLESRPNETGLPQAQRKITGKVTDAKGVALTGVTVAVKGTATGTLTDMNGKFEVNVSGQADILVFSFIGMKPQEVAVGSSSVINIALEEEMIDLNEVVVIG